MTVQFTGKQLQQLMLENGKGFNESAKLLSITPAELQSHFDCEVFEEEVLLSILTKLKIYKIIDKPGAVTKLAIKRFEEYEQKIILLRTILRLIGKAFTEFDNVLKSNATNQEIKDVFQMFVPQIRERVEEIKNL